MQVLRARTSTLPTDCDGNVKSCEVISVFGAAGYTRWQFFTFYQQPVDFVPGEQIDESTCLSYISYKSRIPKRENMDTYCFKIDLRKRFLFTEGLRESP